MTTTHHPTLVAAVDQLPADPARVMDSWWFTARLKAADTVFWAKIHAMTVQGTAHSTVALMREPGGHSSRQQSTDSPDEVTLATSILDIRTPILDIRGDLDAIAITGATDTGSLQLTLRRDEPVLYNGGSGLFPFFGGTTGQYSLPGLTTSGTLTADGTTYEVRGRTWFDRQWGTPGTEPPRFTWLGLDLGGGRYLSVWDTTGDGTSWLTELAADGTHTITRAHRIERNGGWTLTVPRFEGALEIDHRGLPDSNDGLYAGVCEVMGTFAGEDIVGHGYVDIVSQAPA
ncbi:lipocalin-like domain-containing protein [Streptomyces sp. NPDC021098]|uniref:lipocalin-like domain-containing protein n=1 Tax=unclassified Streptomyces TaxID=2593676 RepID=UPI0037AB91B8